MLVIALYVMVAYAVTSLWEATFHRVVLHASDSSRRVWRGWGSLGSLLRLAHFFHYEIHHRRTFARSLVVQFVDLSHRSRIDSRLKGSIGRRARLDRYGLTVSGPFELLAFAGLPLLTNSIMAALVSPGLLWFGLAIAVLPYLLSRYLHPMLHEQPPLATQRSASAKFRRSAVFRFFQRHHLTHHRHDNINFNLLLGADLLQGGFRRVWRVRRGEA
jgi:hypothetical protein